MNIGQLDEKCRVENLSIKIKRLPTATQYWTTKDDDYMVQSVKRGDTNGRLP